MKYLVLPAALAVGALLLAPPAEATSGPDCLFSPQCYVHVAGTGSVTNPGLPCDDSCDVHLDFTLVGVGIGAAGVASCTFDGTTGADTILSGNGSGSIDCSGGVTASGTCSFNRTGPVVVVDCNGTINGYSGTVTAALAFVPTSANPTTSFIVAGTGLVQ
jgi:hypothetical protein